MKNIKAILKFTLPLTFILVFFAIVYKIYIPRINAFGCFDDCFNFMGGYYILGGKKIFTDFFYNHQPGMAYISAFVQFIFNPSNIPELILNHRQFMILTSLVMTVFMFLRFGYRIILVMVIYELSKFYVFGDRFLAENIVGYLIIYQLGVVLDSFKKTTNKYDLLFMPLAGIFVFLLREPYVIAMVFLQVIYLLKLFKNHKNLIKFPILLFTLFLILFFLFVNISDYFFNLITINRSVLSSDINNQPLFTKIIYIILYPFFLMFSSHPWTYFRSLLALVSGLFVLTSLLHFSYLKEKSIFLVIFATLILVNLRPSAPNVTFFEVFNLSVWLITFLFSISYLIFEIKKAKPRAGYFLVSMAFIIILIFVTDKKYFAYEKINQNDEFFTNYSHAMGTGTTIRNLSDSNDTLFVDGLDDLIIWEAKIKSSYKYSWYTSFMPSQNLYKSERAKMFKATPPDFYFGMCKDDLRLNSDEVSKILSEDYIQINPQKDTKCILIHKNKVDEISELQKEKLRDTKYKLP